VEREVPVGHAHACKIDHIRGPMHQIQGFSPSWGGQNRCLRHPRGRRRPRKSVARVELRVEGLGREEKRGHSLHRESGTSAANNGGEMSEAQRESGGDRKGLR